MRKSVKAWHFLQSDYRLGHGDNRKVKAGSRVTVSGTPELCNHGLHGCRKVLDALGHATGPIVCRVIISGQIIEDCNKLVGAERYVEWTLDATWYLHEFACWCAESALKETGVSDPRPWAAIAAKRQWMNGDLIDDELAAARAAARDAAWTAAWGAAWAAARGAAWDTARAAARGAARDAAWDATWDAQNRKLTRMLNAAE